MTRFLPLALLVLLCPAAAEAYVDPGLISVLYQFLYVAVFGTLASLVFKPWRYVRSWFGGKTTGEADVGSDPSPVDGDHADDGDAGAAGGDGGGDGE